MQYVALSHVLEENSPVHLNLKEPEITQNSNVSDGDGYNSFIINVENHSGTHVDTPSHFLEGGKTISEYQLDELFFKKPLILDIIKGPDELIELQDIQDIDMNGVDCLFIRTGFEVYRDNRPDKYQAQNPGISSETVHWIRENFQGIHCLGIDSVSISGYNHPEDGRKAHINAFKESESLGEPLLLIEDMKLGSIKTEDLEWVMAVPWQIARIDSAPCTVIAKLV